MYELTQKDYIIMDSCCFLKLASQGQKADQVSGISHAVTIE